MKKRRKGLLALRLCLPAVGQEKRVEHNFYIRLDYATEFTDEEAQQAFMSATV